MEQHGITINTQLMAKRVGNYTVYVFKNLETSSYITVTKCPNWNDKEIDVGQEGFLTYRYVRAYVDIWYDKATGSDVYNQYSGNYYLSFIPSSYVVKDGSVVSTELFVK